MLHNLPDLRAFGIEGDQTNLATTDRPHQSPRGVKLRKAIFGFSKFVWFGALSRKRFKRGRLRTRILKYVSSAKAAYHYRVRGIPAFSDWPVTRYRIAPASSPAYTFMHDIKTASRDQAHDSPGFSVPAQLRLSDQGANSRVLQKINPVDGTD